MASKVLGWEGLPEMAEILMPPRRPADAARTREEGLESGADARPEATPGPAGPARPAGAPTVIYIAGSGRSGSTLMERVLGEMPGYVNVGELIDLFRRTAALNERCGCGLDFAQCPFWTAVGARACGDWRPESIAEVQRLQARVARQRRLPRLVATSVAGRAFRADVASYAEHYARLYSAIASAAGSACVVDASKWPVQALALRRGGLDIRVIHLVRDARGVAYSLGKHIVRPHATGEVDVMAHSGAAGAAVRWLTCQAEAEVLRWCGLPVARVRYEDFVRSPSDVVAAALARLGLPPAASGLAHVKGAELDLSPSHGLSGNPTRFRAGKITLRADEAWRTAMPRRDRAMVTAISLPLMVRYGLSRPGAAAGEQTPHG